MGDFATSPRPSSRRIAAVALLIFGFSDQVHE